MSGGHFDYDQYRILEIARELESLIENNNIPVDDFGYVRNYDDSILEIFNKVKNDIEVLFKHIDKIDRLVSGDIGEESFLEHFNKVD